MWQDRQPSNDTFDTMHVALAHRRRRFIVYELWQSDPLSLGELTDRLLEWERFTPDARDRRAVTASLERTHLPMLDRANVVDFDARTRMVGLASTGPTASEIRRLAITQAQK